MNNRIFILAAAVLMFCATSFAAEYDWTGADGDLIWDNAANWDVTGSIWTWPNEEYASSRVNQDCDEINIATGGIVDRFGSLNISGADDGSNEVVLTVDNSSELNIHDYWGKDIGIAYGYDSRGRVEVRGGSHLELVDGAIRIGEGNTSVGTLNIIDGTVDIAQWLIVGRTSTGIVEVENGTLNIAGWDNWSSLYVAYKSNSTGTMNVKNGNINIEGSLLVGNSDNSTGTVEIKNSDLNINKYLSVSHGGAGTFGSMEIKDNSIIDIGNALIVGNSASSTGTVEIEDSTLDIGNALMVGNSTSSIGTVEIKNSTLDIGIASTIGDLIVGNSASSTGTVEIEDSSVQIGMSLQLGQNDLATGTVEIKNSDLNIGKHLSVGSLGTSTGTLEIKNSSIEIVKHLIVAGKNSSVGIMNIGDGSTIFVGGRFRMNNKADSGSVSEVVMDGGSVSVGGYTAINHSSGVGSIANFTLNDGIWDSSGDINVGNTLYGDSYLTINGGTMVTGRKIFVGRNGGGDSGESRIFLNGGLLQGEVLVFDLIADSSIVYKGGELWFKTSNIV